MISIIIQHNISALNSFRNTNKNKKALNKNLERLSSGYKINRAGDDAAGLAISESMRSRIRGIDQAERNILDGIGLIHTAEGAMQEIHSMLQRSYQLSIASANGTYSNSDRECMQEEVSALLTELNRIATHTEYNGIPVLQGFRVPKPSSGTGGSGSGSIAIPWPSWVTNADGSVSAGYLKGIHTTTETYKDGSTHSIRHAAATLDFSAIDTSGANIDDLVGVGFKTTCFTCPRYYNIEFVKDGLGHRMSESGKDFIFKVDITGLTTAADLTQAIVDATQNGNPNHHFTVFEANGGKLAVYDTRSIDKAPAGATDPNGWIGWDLADFNVNFSTNPRGGRFGVTQVYNPSPYPPPVSQGARAFSGDIAFQIGASASEIMGIDLPDIDTWEMGLTEVNVSNQARASIAVGTLKQTIDFISEERGRMGSYESRLEHAYNSQAVTKENLTAAESRIRDTDMADEITLHTKNNILLQAAQAMLAQANATPQNILQLLQS